MLSCIINTASGEEKTLPINKDIIEQKTLKRYPCYQTPSNDKHVFGKCTFCGNPVQIIGFYRQKDLLTMDYKKKPFARHYRKDVKGIAIHNQDTYEQCPYKRPWQYNKADKRIYNTDVSKQIKSFFIEHFDKIVRVIKNDTGILYGSSILKKMIASYKQWDAWQYIGASLENIPWVFLYMSDSQDLFGQYIQKNSRLYSEIKKKKHGAKLIDNKDTVQLNGFINPSYILTQCFTNHTSKPNNGVIDEKITIVISLQDKINEKNNITLLEQRINFDKEHFFKLINYKSWNSNSKLLKLVEDQMK